MTRKHSSRSEEEEEEEYSESEEHYGGEDDDEEKPLEFSRRKQILLSNGRAWQGEARRPLF